MYVIEISSFAKLRLRGYLKPSGPIARGMFFRSWPAVLAVLARRTAAVRTASVPASRAAYGR